jgi:hypothetical protein
MAAPPAAVKRAGVLSLELLKPAGMLHDISMQARLYEFCVAQTAGCPAPLREWLAPPAHRPLWQLSVVAMALNGGLVMMTEGAEHDAVHLECTVPLLGALNMAEGPAPPAEQSPYEYEKPAETPAPGAGEDDAASFEQELHNLTLSECAGR